ncbi:nucleoside triphosphate pyrophosphohydrolase [Microcoleus sp. herbarium19]|uniref:nucleoside triphosphate pyrophosphohydrolase n=1 Tax=unclassified Microcoleus TaxID=2642155 RepID=UPI002FCF2DCD
MGKEYNKLVRDRIPEIIQQSGIECETAVLSDAEYRIALRLKLIEEATEVAEANENELVTELADLYEVIDTLILSYGISENCILNAQAKRRETRGSFTEKIILLRTF